MRTLLALLFLTATAHAEDYELKVSDASLSIVPAAGHELHRGAGVIIRLTPPDGVTLKKKRLQLSDAADPRADAPRFDIPFTAAPGSYVVAADVRFWLCAKKTCKPIRAKADVTITATGP